MQEQYAYSSPESPKRPSSGRLRVKRYGSTPESNDSLPKPESAPAHAASSVGRNDSPPRLRSPRRPTSPRSKYSNGTPSRIKHYRSDVPGLESPPPPVIKMPDPTIESLGSDDESDEVRKNDASGSFPSHAPESSSSESGEYMFDSESEVDAFFNYESSNPESESDRDVRSKETIPQHAEHRNNLNKSTGNEQNVSFQQQKSTPDYVYEYPCSEHDDQADGSETNYEEESYHSTRLSPQRLSQQDHSEYMEETYHESLPKLNDSVVFVEESYHGETPVPSPAKPLSSLSSVAATRQVHQQRAEEDVEAPRFIMAAPDLDDATLDVEDSQDGDMTESSVMSSASKLMGIQRQNDANERRQAMGAIMAEALVKKDKLAKTEIREKAKPEPQEPKRMAALKSTPVQEKPEPKPQEPKRLAALKSTSTQEKPKPAESQEAKQLVALKPANRDDNNGVEKNKRQEPEQRKRELEAVANEDDDEQARRSRRQDLEQRKRGLEAVAAASKNSTSMTSVSLGTSTSLNSEKKVYTYSVRKREPMIDLYTGEVIGEMTDSGDDASDAGSSEHSDETSSDDSSAAAGGMKKRRAFMWGGLLLFLLAGIGLMVYFLALYQKDSDSSAPSVESVPAPPTFRPPTVPGIAITAPPHAQASPARQPISRPSPTPRPQSPADTSGPVSTPISSSTLQPGTLPAQNPTLQPAIPPISDVTIQPVTPSPTKGPTPLPSQITDNSVRDLIVSAWPNTEDDLSDGSPQFAASEWLSMNSELSSYSDDKKLQRFALATLYYSTGGDRWLNNDLWLSDEDECLWFSASADRSPCDDAGSFANLELELNDLSGTIPAELVLLSNSLTRIHITRVGEGLFLGGDIPTELGLLTKLEVINLRGNRLAGFLPSEFGNLQQVKTIDLSNNSLFGEVPSEIGLLSKLSRLNLDDNQFMGSLPTVIGKLLNMRTLSLRMNDFDGPIPSEIGHLQLLQNLSLEANQFSLLPSEMGNLILLQTLSLSENNLQGQIPSEIGNLVSVLSLDLSGNSFAGSIPSEIGKINLIENYLDLSDNQLSGTIPAELGRLILLRNLFMHSNQLTGQIPESFAALGRLGRLRLESNDLTGSVPNSVCAVYSNSYPLFVTDCATEMFCSCCVYCCEDEGDCTCQFEDTGLNFLCSEYT